MGRDSGTSILTSKAVREASQRRGHLVVRNSCCSFPLLECSLSPTPPFNWLPLSTLFLSLPQMPSPPESLPSLFPWLGIWCLP